MSWERYPNANYPKGWDEANMVKADSVSTNVTGGGLTVGEVGAGNGPLHVDADALEAEAETTDE